METDVVVIGGGVVGVATALELARRGREVMLAEAEPGLALSASGTSSGVLHTGFDSTPGELETRLILRSAALRPAVLDALRIPVLRCGAVLRDAPPGLAGNARANGVEVALDAAGDLHVPGEHVTDPVAYTHALAAAAVAHGASVLLRTAAARIVAGPRVELAGGGAITARAVVNAAGLGAHALAPEETPAVHPRKGEFLVFDVAPPERILLPRPTARTKGVLVFPTLDGRTVAGPTAVDLDAPDWTVSEAGRADVLGKARAAYPPLEGAEPVFAYAGLRVAGRDGANYVVDRSPSMAGVVHVGAIRSTGLSASLGIAEHVAGLLGVAADPAPLDGGPWWRRSAGHWL